MAGNAFVYGTLMAPEVLKLLINRVPPMRPAVIRGYRRHCVKGQVFPAIVPDVQDSQVEGQVLIGLNDKEIHILDVYESEEYYKQAVKPVIEDGTTVDAVVYVWSDKFRELLDYRPWDYGEFLRCHLDDYLTSSKEFVEVELLKLNDP